MFYPGDGPADDEFSPSHDYDGNADISPLILKFDRADPSASGVPPEGKLDPKILTDTAATGQCMKVDSAESISGEGFVNFLKKCEKQSTVCCFCYARLLGYLKFPIFPRTEIEDICFFG